MKRSNVQQIAHKFAPKLSGLVLALAGKSCYRGMLTTVDLLALTSLDQLLLHWKCFFTFLQNKLPYLGGQLHWAFPLR